MVVTRGKGGLGEVEEGKGGQIYGDRWRLDWVVNTMQYTDDV